MVLPVELGSGALGSQTHSTSLRRFLTSLNLWLKDGKLPEYSIHELACGLVRALLYLHSKGIIYCDLKLSNILLDENGITKLANLGILGARTDGLRDRQEKVRRFSMAALGELLFYISTQNEHARDNKPMESPSKDNRPSSYWQVPSPLISLVSSLLRNGEDNITQIYALRTIENIFSQGGALGKQEITRLTTGSYLARLVHFNPYSTSHGITFIQGYVFKTRQA
uniref:EMB3013 n=1 Tax=Solanum tuberosum TaxID=4113 RepID=M1BE80_SOLTU